MMMLQRTLFCTLALLAHVNAEDDVNPAENGGSGSGSGSGTSSSTTTTSSSTEPPTTTQATPEPVPDGFKPSFKAEDGDIWIDSLDVQFKLRGTDAEFTLAGLLRDLVALQEGRDALHAATTTLKERVTVAEGAISDGLATIGTVEDSVNETYVSLSETVGANAALLEAAGGVKEQVEADIESAQTKSASDSKLHLKAMDNIATQMKDAADVITPTVDAMVANTNPRSSRVGTIIDSGSTLLMTGEEEFFTDKWIHDMSSGKRVWSVPREGRYLLSWTGQTLVVGGGNGFSKVRLVYIVDGTDEVVLCKIGSDGRTDATERMMAEFHQSAAFGKVSFGFNFNWFCDVPAAAKVYVQGWTNCGNNRCGITNNDNGYEELGWALVDKINTNPFTYMEGAITDTGIFKKSSDPHQLAKLLRWNTDSDAAGRWVTMLTARSYISAGANGLVMLFPRPSSYRPPDYPKRVMAMWQGYTGGGFMNHHVPMTWMVDMIQTRRGFVTLWGGNSNGGMGLQNDGNGWTGMDMLKVDPAHSYVRIGIGNINNGGLEHPFENEFTDLLGYYWDLPSAGTYTLTATVRAYTTAAGWAKVKLSVADLYSDATSELLVNDVDDVKYGESTRLLISWDQKKFERMEHAVSFTWSGIKVTGGMRVIMQGMRSDGGSGAIGTHSDGVGACTFLYYKTEDMLAPMFGPDKDA